MPPLSQTELSKLPARAKCMEDVYTLVLDLDETLLHSSIAPLPTYDIVFPVHFNSINYQACAAPKLVARTWCGAGGRQGSTAFQHFKKSGR